MTRRRWWSPTWTGTGSRRCSPPPGPARCCPTCPTPPGHWRTPPQIDDLAANGLGQQLAALPAAERERVLTTAVRESAAAVLGYAAGIQVSTEQPFKELGFDSLTAVELRNLLQTRTGTPLPSSIAFDYPTVAHVVGYLAGVFGGPQPEERRRRGPQWGRLLGRR